MYVTIVTYLKIVNYSYIENVSFLLYPKLEWNLDVTWKARAVLGREIYLNNLKLITKMRI